MSPSQILTCFISLSKIFLNPKFTSITDSGKFIRSPESGKFLNMSIYRLLKNFHNLTVQEISLFVYELGKGRLGTEKVMGSVRKQVKMRLGEYKVRDCFRLLMGWMSNGRFVEQDQGFLEMVLQGVMKDLGVLREEELVEMYYMLYGRSYVGVELEYLEEIEGLVMEKCDDFDFTQFAQVLATLKFQEKS